MGLARRLLTTAIFALAGSGAAWAFAVHYQRGRDVCAAAGGSLDGRRVLVTGAAGRTGKKVFQSLQAKPGFQPVALVRSEKAANGLKKAAGATPEQIVIGDVMDKDSLKKAVAGCDAVILCTSATPKIVWTSIVKIMFKKLLRKEPGRPQFVWPKNGEPEIVDYVGALNQIDAAAEEGVSHFVFLGSMGGTQPDNFLNTIGKKPDGTGGDILKWKRKAEKYLIQKAAEKGFAYSIVHPGGLTDKPGNELSIVLDVDDKLLSRKTRSIPRQDVAEICVQTLLHPEAKNKSFDAIAEEGPVTTDFGSLFLGLGAATCKYDD